MMAWVWALLVISTAYAIGATNQTAQKEALLTLYETTHGDHWLHNTNWKNDMVEPCGTNGKEWTINNWGWNVNGRGWYGVICNPATGAVATLSLPSNNLMGQIAATTLLGLPSLEDINLTNNSLGGSIPPELATLTKLNILWLNNNMLTSSIPTELATLTSLQYLYLDINAVTGAHLWG